MHFYSLDLSYFTYITQVQRKVTDLSLNDWETERLELHRVG